MNDISRKATAIEAIYGRRAVRSYAPKDLDRPTIEALLDAAVQAPSAVNAQPWGFVVVQGTERLARYSARAKTLMAAKAAAEPKMHRMADLLADPSYDIFYDARTLIVICSAGPWADADCWLAAENLMLAAYAMGLGTCCIGFALPLLAEADVKRELGIPDDWKACAPIIVGVPSEAPPPVPRNPPRILSWT